MFQTSKNLYDLKITMTYLKLNGHLSALISWKQFCLGNFDYKIMQSWFSSIQIVSVPVDIYFTNTVVAKNSLLRLFEVILLTCITYKENQIVPSQSSLFFTNPSLHRQLYDPGVFSHSELSTSSHGLTCAVHSLMSKIKEL